MSILRINSHKIGEDNSTYIIAEMSANHNQDFKSAVKIIESAKKAGADAVKVQTFTPDTITLDCDNKYFRIKGTIWNGQTLYDLYKKAYMPWDWYPRLQKVAKKIDIDFFSSPFDNTAVDFLKKLKAPAYKVASSELIDTNFLKKIALTKKPIIMSTGMATLEEIKKAVKVVRSCGNDKIALLKCTAVYPALPKEMNLKAICELRDRFGVVVGLSDHTLGIEIPVAAVALGASIIEKHLTLSKSDGGVDSGFSLDPKEFKDMVQAVRKTEQALGKVKFGSFGREKNSRNYRRSLFVVKDIKAGDKMTHCNVKSIRPGYGISPDALDKVIGKKVLRNIKRGIPLSQAMLG
ncbi:MAG: pseudaminic acid synthase [Candidatus Zapsychrus exili]|nr:pseudaminic acid synthase [Candidatus Zapsychrus exili]